MKCEEDIEGGSLDAKHDDEEEKGGKDKDEAEKDPDRQSCQASRVRGGRLSKLCQNAVLGIDGWSVVTSKTELNILTRTSRVVIRRPLRLETSSRGRRKLDQETATKNPVDANRSSL